MSTEISNLELLGTDLMPRQGIADVRQSFGDLVTITKHIKFTPASKSWLIPIGGRKMRL